MREKSTSTDRIKRAFELALSRSATSKEMTLLTAAAARYTAHYKANVAEATELTKVGLSPRNPKLDTAELASWTLICSTLFNLDEFLTQN
ncbi:MAG: hypothetical protein K8R88_00560 [Armatimonadetes bacterium]|nr:hypothetical protein [Armatimonadota bacterium]